jgi:alpha-mannosidase
MPLKNRILLVCFFFTTILATKSFSQRMAYFIDGYHGGVYGHYPVWNTQFMADMLNKNPQWKINLEIEPETWDTAKVRDPKGYEEFKALFADQSDNGRIEYVSPAYGQSYLYNISGESMIRQFYYGIKKVREHFPTAVFTTYSSEEPCFTSALPQVLKSFGYKYASLKNPNTCWGGYTKAFGGELVNWIGPDGTRLITVPRYAVEALKTNSTWQTISTNNSKEFIDAAFQNGIEHPVGMTLQDAGWKNGPWLGNGAKSYQPTEYKTWRNYIGNTAVKNPGSDWKLSQQDILVSIVWGSQVLQKIAQQVRVSENKIVSAEKMAAIAGVYRHTQWPQSSFDEAWRTLLLSQHHDCWIVPYNGKPGNTWADKVVSWTANTNQRSDSIIKQSILGLSDHDKTGHHDVVRVFNTSLSIRQQIVNLDLTGDRDWQHTKIIDVNKNEVASQITTGSLTGNKQILFKADIPSLGYNTYKLVSGHPAHMNGASIRKQQDGLIKMETDLYSITVDPLKGGTIKSLVAKKLSNKEFVDRNSGRKFNELRGNFFASGGFHSSTESPAQINIIENGPLRVSIEIKGTINEHPFTQMITVTQGQKRIDMHVNIDWKGNPGIGNEYAQNIQWKPEDYRKAFYDDSFKLLTLFPLNLKSQKVYINAPFDVTESKLSNTFFQTWDSIKNNIVLSWVDVIDGSDNYGVTLFTDHTTSYAHGKNHPLGLTAAYSGIGLWGRNYSITGPTSMSYALVPHAGKWDKSGIWMEGINLNEPLIASLTSSSFTEDPKKSLVSISGSGVEVTTLLLEGSDLVVRLFNAEGDKNSRKISFDAQVDKVELVQLNGQVINSLKVYNEPSGKSYVNTAIPHFGIQTLKVHFPK